MAQAATLNEAQIKRALRFCQSRKYTTRDVTILQFSIYTGLRAKERNHPITTAVRFP